MGSSFEGTTFGAAAAQVAGGTDPHAVAADIVAAMTLEERLGCLDGDTPFWPGLLDMVAGGYYEHPWPAAGVPRLGVPGIRFADGPRGCVVGRATAFPVAMGRGASFDPDLEERIGAAIGAELRASGATFTGAVCVNLLRHPAWGRAQETYGEDPYHVGEMGAALATGLQRHVMACVKHFALNSMENARFRVDVTVDERALHEVYLPHFRRVTGTGVASVMSAYNSVNGEWCGENRTLLTMILRDEWGWDGFVVSDFVYGLRDPVRSVQAGLDVELPFRQQRAVHLPGAIERGDLDVDDVDAACRRVVATLLRFQHLLDEASAPAASVVACDEHRGLAREAAVASTVLLTNREAFLPLAPAGLRRVAVLGPLAAVANLGDGGSSDVHPPSAVTLLDGLREALPGSEVVHHPDDPSVAAGADVAVVVVGLTKHDEGEYLDQDAMGVLAMALAPPVDHPELGIGAVPPEGAVPRAESRAAAEAVMAPGGDRASLRLSGADETLVAGACAANPNTVVVVMGGSAVVMPWAELPAAVLTVWYPGMEGGRALADVLLGRSEPGGRLPFAVPTDEAHLAPFDRDADTATYGLFHGQWLLDRDGRSAHFPFGHGLGYTTWSVDGAVVDVGLLDRPEECLDAGTEEEPGVTVTLTNSGSRDGSTVVFVFGGVPGSVHERPSRRLIGFRKVAVRAGVTVDVNVPVDLAVLDVRIDGGWVREERRVRVQVGLDAVHLVDAVV